jgi:hypothetical protein
MVRTFLCLLLEGLSCCFGKSFGLKKSERNEQGEKGQGEEGASEH